MRNCFIFLLTLIIFGCSSYHAERVPTVLSSNQWAMMPVANYSQSPLAGEQLEDLLTSLLFQKGVALAHYPRQDNISSLTQLTASPTGEFHRKWLANQKADYVLSGSVQEWHYKTGLDGEPAVTVTLTLRDKSTNELIWSASGARSGWARESIGYAAHQVLETLLAELPLGD
ncbi:hypothetical protein A9Q98_13105 [Thalassotalea sp. 42_200_T64]|nr:hypothetical protein A9Q98_13105 [Thalassotalea sp. 42_200_T64]